MSANALQAGLLDAERTREELLRKVQGLCTELGAWERATVGEEPPLGRHHTQVTAIAGTLRAAARRLEQKLSAEGGGMSLLERARSIDAQVLDLHRLWGFFRAKLALRYVPWIDEALEGVDDFAWACYAPVQPFVAADRRREPPLIHFAGGTSPFLMPRGSIYAVEPLPDGGMREPQFDDAVRSMPVAVIGLPWFQARHMPDAPLIAHEVGHAAEHDLGLHDAVRAAVSAAVPRGHREAWGAWSSEVFADVYGTLACGPAFTRALAALLAVHPRDVAGEVLDREKWGAYPPRTVRVLLSAAVAEALGILPADASVADAWLRTYEQRPDTEFEADARPVAKTVLAGPLGRAGPRAVLAFTQEDENAADQLAKQLLRGIALPEGTAQQVAAAARLAYDRNRHAYADKEADAIALARIAAVPTDRIRGPDGPEPAPEPDRDARDRLAGAQLLGLIEAAELTDDDEEADDVPT